MPIHTRNELRNQLRQKNIQPVYLLFGAETYLRDLAAQTITEFLLKDANLREFNENELSLMVHPLADAFAAANQLPIVDATRVVRVRDVIVSATKSKDTILEDDDDIIKAYLADPSPSSVIIFVAGEMDKRRKVFKTLSSGAYSVEFGRLNDSEMLSWLKDRISRWDVRCDDNALRYLIARIGDDARSLTNELDKLATAALPDGEISVELIDELSPVTRELNNFELTDRLLAHQPAEALEVCKKILDDGAEPVMLLGLLSYNFHKLLSAKSLMAQGAGESEVFGAARMQTRDRERFLRTARRSNIGILTRIVMLIADTDRAIKTSTKPPRLAIEMLVCEIAKIAK